MKSGVWMNFLSAHYIYIMVQKWLKTTTYTHYDQTHYKCSICIPYSNYHRATLVASQITIILGTKTLTEVFELL